MPFCSFAFSSSFICGVSHICPVSSVNSFFISCRLVVDRVSDIVDYWVTFNEPHVFCMLTYCAGAWPGGHPDMLEVATSALPTGVFQQAMHWMAIAHSKAYDYIHEKRFLFFTESRMCERFSYKFEILNLEHFHILHGPWTLNVPYCMDCSTMFDPY